MGGEGGGGEVLTEVLYEEAPPRDQELTLLYTILDRKSTPFVIPLETKLTYLI